MRSRVLGLAASAALLLSACASVSVGRDFDLATFESKVQRGVTTQADVQAWLGAPVSIGTDMEPDGSRYDQWTYYRGTGNLPDLQGGNFTMLQIKFDGRGVVQGYNWTGRQ